MPSKTDYQLCNWRVESTLALPDLLPWTSGAQAPDLVIDIGAVPERLPDLVVERPFFQASADGHCRYAVPGVASYLVDPKGQRVVIAPEMAISAPDIRVFLLGTVFGILCYRRGLIPLHASCVRIGEGAVAFSGQSGIGKSTLAATFMRRGHDVLADDITVIDVHAPGGPCVLPAFPRLKLWQNALDRLSLSKDGLENSRSDLAKYHLPVAAFHAAPLRLHAIFQLDPDDSRGNPPLRQLRGPEAVARVGRDLYRRAMMARLGLSKETLAATLRLAAIPCGCWRLSHDHAEGGLSRSVDAILGACNDAAGP